MKTGNVEKLLDDLYDDLHDKEEYLIHMKNSKQAY